MTTPDATHRQATAVGRAWRWFRRWRRGRPFWGGLFSILAAIEYYLSGHLDVLPVAIHIGPQGFLSYVIPLILLLCGILLWATPAQRIFYGIVGAVTAIYGLIGLNLGGFLLGLLLGMVGGALGASWAPVTLPPAEGQPAEPPDGTAGPDGDTGPDGGALPDGNTPAGAGRVVGGSPLTDTLPVSTVSPLHQRPAGEAEPGPASVPAQTAAQPAGGQAAQPAGKPAGERAGTPGPAAGTAGVSGVPPAIRPATGPAGTASDPAEAPPGPAGDLPRRTPRLTLSLIVFLVLALGLALTAHAVPASAAPCPSPSAIPTGPATTASPAPTTVAATGRSSGNPILNALNGLINGVKKIFGRHGTTATPAATPTGQPQGAAALADCTTPAPVGSATGGSRSTGPTAKPSGVKTSGPAGRPSASGRPSAAPTVGAVKRLAAGPDQPLVPVRPGIMTTASLVMTGLSFDGVVDLPTHNGTVRALRFSMDTATNTPFELDTSDGGPTIAQVSSQLEISGHVTFFTSKLQGRLLGLLPVTFTPDSPPPLTIPDLFFTDVTIELVYVHADRLTAANLHGFNKG